ncbi:MAG: radical SAM protein [Candidatus Parvarchaeota archaeon]|nr:radical SAM protein [Candidatus Haiyanarchaeum thermophilum]MCW1307322.1 radical SAM protein [Candidatus Haiyanarchaeum thermophilum]MCW1307938.1 radical SAM protein [Candidatus Haiyanarchaeum thermophilum]
MLERYFKILRGEVLPNFQIAKRIQVDRIPSSLDEKLEIHAEKMEELRERREKVEDCEAKPNLLDLKLSILQDYSKSCNLCERRCGVNRGEGEIGFCRVREARVASEFLHFGEEPELVPSHTIFFAGCNFNCVFCQNWDISQYPENGAIIEPVELSRIIEFRFKGGSRNLNLVGGEPTPNAAYILEVLRELKANIPIVWNSNMYMSRELMQILDGVIDIYLTDFKYGNDECALRLSNVPKYMEVVSRNHLLAAKQCELIIRHLILPNHIVCCSKPVIDWIEKQLGTDVYLNLMDQYRPEYKAMKHKEISRFLRFDEYREVVEYALSKGFKIRL